MVWYGLKQGLRPLERLRREVLNRKRDDLSLIDGSKAPAEVRPLIDAVNDLLLRLKQMMAAQQRFVADAAHQLRTPFAGLKTQSELALRTNDPQQKQHALQHIHTSTEHGIRLVNQLLALARNEPGGQRPTRTSPLSISTSWRRNAPSTGYRWHWKRISISDLTIRRWWRRYWAMRTA